MNGSEGAECAIKNEVYDDARFALVLYFGTPIACIGIVFNTILLILFWNRQSITSSNIYLLFLALFDTLICILYIPFFTMDALAIYCQIDYLHHLWHTYALHLYGTSRFVQFGAVYMMLCATFERYVYVTDRRHFAWFITDSGRIMIVIIVLITAMILRFPTFFDYNIAYNGNCPPFQEYLFVPVLTAYSTYVKYNFYIMSLVQTVLPFAFLTCFNLIIIYLTHKRLHYIPTNEQLDQSNRSDKVKTDLVDRIKRQDLKFATRKMVAIVFIYLLCNVFSVLIIIMENIFPDSRILHNEDGSSTKFYTITADLISILVVLNSLLRLIVYIVCDPQLRQRFINLFIKFRFEN
ncbi:unnamed protein product [Thelazia callipaeda]|uniref:G_PROTEIN_RECEP_F1_2 domain-containing protein n=1 Tax=Thelazia callipaeda TaxID=103827 RepID=A0A0N5CRN9_THECL|nr:unnamed protein product [Thelazia callipaeda]